MTAATAVAVVDVAGLGGALADGATDLYLDRLSRRLRASAGSGRIRLTIEEAEQVAVLADRAAALWPGAPWSVDMILLAGDLQERLARAPGLVPPRCLR